VLPNSPPQLNIPPHSEEYLRREMKDDENSEEEPENN
jgi:hypothetical protein